MTGWKELMVPKVEEIEDGRMRVVLSVGEEEVAVLYFEKAKRGFVNKPIIQEGWACVDAKVDGLYNYVGDTMTPKELVSWCQELISYQRNSSKST